MSKTVLSVAVDRLDVENIMLFYPLIHDGRISMRLLIVAFALVFAVSSARAQEYCLDQYDGAITAVSAELGSVVKRQAELDKRLTEIFTRTSGIAGEIAQAATKVPPDTATVQKLAAELYELNREKAKLETEAYGNQDRVVALKGAIPAELQGRLRGCVEASAPAGKIVNLTIQALAILSTGGASLLLPPKSLYVDMSAVLNGYPTGGPNSIINETRQKALDALGIGGKNNDIGKAVRDPGRVIRCIFGC
jgi:hypothetical protein